MAVTINYTFTSESVVGTNEIVEQQSLHASASLVGNTLPISLGGQHQKISLISLHTSESLVGSNNFVKLVGQHDKPINTYVPPSVAYVTTGLMLHLDAEQSGSQTYSDIGGTGTFANAPLWQSLDNYDPPSQHTVLNESGRPFNIGDSIWTTGSLAIRMDNFPDNLPFVTDGNGVKSADFTGGNDRGVIGTGISDLLNNDDGAALWRFEDVREFSAEFWLRPQDHSAQSTIFHTSFNYKLRIMRINNTLRVLYWNGIDTATKDVTGVFADNTWVHLVVTVSVTDDALYIYKNGSLNSSATGANFTYNPLANLSNVPNPSIRLGEFSGGSNTYVGEIAICRLYDFPLSSEQVSQNYNAELSRYE